MHPLGQNPGIGPDGVEAFTYTDDVGVTFLATAADEVVSFP